VIVLTFPSIAPGETNIRAQDVGLDVTVGYCARVGGEWTAVLYRLPDHPRPKVATIDRPTLADLRNAVCGRLAAQGKWWR
jgi:hypothetical protein